MPGLQTVIKLTAENIKRLKAVEIIPPEEFGVIVVAGNNGQGKSSVLDSMSMAVGGAKEQCAEPVRAGEEEGRVFVETQDYRAKLFVRKDGKRRFELSAKDGSRIGSPQTLWNSFVADCCLDPSQFLNLTPREQVNALQKALGFDPGEYNAKRRDLEEQRRNIGQQKKALPNPVNQTQLPPEPKRPEAEVMAEKVEAKRVLTLRNDAENKIQNSKAEIEKLTRELVEAEQELKENMEHLVRLPKPGNIQALDDELQVIRIWEHSKSLRSQAKAIEGRRESLEFQWDELTTTIRNLDKAHADKVAQAKMPLEGLSYDQTGIRYNGVPLEQCCQTERLMVAVGLAVAQNPKFRVVLLREASLFDDHSMAFLRELAVKYSVQIWAEKVGKDQEGPCVIIEDGEVAQVKHAEGGI